MSYGTSGRKSLWLGLVVVAVGAVMVLPGGAVASATGGRTASGLSPLVGEGLSGPASLTDHAPSMVSPSDRLATAASHLPSPDIVRGSSPEDQWLRTLLQSQVASKSPPLASLPNIGLLEQPGRPPEAVANPFYQSQPAPMGIADFGLGPNGPYSYNTSHLNGQFTFSAPPNDSAPGSEFVIDPGAASLGEVGSPYEFSVQLNTVTNNITIPGSDDGNFWTQNVLDVNNTGIHFVDAVFNLTGAVTRINDGTIYSGCNNFNVTLNLEVYGGVYQCVGTTIPISSSDFPLTISLYNNATVNAHNMDVVSFGYRFGGAGGFLATGVSDTLVFVNPNNAAVPATKPGFSIDGYAATPSGLLRDAEMILGGQIEGSNAVFTSLGGSAELLYSNASSGGWKSVPSAYDFGTDTGETSTGVTGYWTTSGVEEINQGPSWLYGLWGGLKWASVAAGDIQLSGALSPDYGFVFLSNVAPGALGQNLSYLPTNALGDFDTYLPPAVPPGTEYYIQSWADGYAELNGTPFSTTTLALAISLPPAPGVDHAPLYANGNAQATLLAQHVISPTAMPPFVYSDLSVGLNLSFNHLNDWSYPSFVLFQEQGVTDAVSVSNVTQGPDSPLGTIYWYDDPLPLMPSGFLSPGPNLSLIDRPQLSEQFNFFLSSDAKVSNETLYGPSYESIPFPTAGAVFLWKDTDLSVSRVAVENGSYGVFVGDSIGLSVKNVLAEDGSNAVDDVGSTGTAVWNVTSTGPFSVGVYVLSSAGGTYSWVNTSLEGYGVYWGEYYAPGYSGWGANSTAIEHVDATSDAYAGVAGVLSTDVSVEWLNASGGSTGLISALGSDDRFVDLRVVGGLGVEIVEDSSDLVQNLEVSDTPTQLGALLEGTVEVDVENLMVDGAGVGLENFLGYETTFSTVWDSAASTEALFDYGSVLTSLSYLHVNASGTLGANATDDGGFFGEYLTTVGPPTVTLYGGFDNELDDGENAYASAAQATGPTNGGLVLADWHTATVTDTVASNGSFGVGLEYGTADVAVSDTTATNGSVGVLMDDEVSDVSVSQTVVSGLSTGVAVIDSGGIDISGVFATNATLTPGFVYNAAGILVTAVGTEDAYQVQVSDVNASNYPFGEIDFGSGAGTFGPGSVDIQDLNATGGLYAVYLDGTEHAVVSAVSAYRDYIGVFGDDDRGNVITDGRFVDSTSYGVALLGSSNDTVWENSFIGNNGATSVYSAAHIQGFDNGTGDLWYMCNPSGACSGNYWADWHTYTATGALAPYLIAGNDWDYYPLGLPVGEYAVTFVENGLPSGTSWSVTFDGSTQSSSSPSIVFGAVPGSYVFSVSVPAGYSVTPANGTISTASGPQTAVLDFALIPVVTLDSVTLTESGLPAGTSWQAVFDGVVESSTTATMTFSVAPGTYTYQVEPVAGFAVAPASGSATVGGAYTVAVTFTPLTYALTIAESGLPTGTSWSATVNGVTQPSVGSSVTFYLPDGTYSYTVSAVSGYTMTGGTGSVKVNGTAVGAAVAFSPSSTTSVVSSNTFNTGFAVALAIAVIALLVGLIALFGRRRKPVAETPPPPTAWTPPAAQGPPPTTDVTSSPPTPETPSAPGWSEGPPNPP